MEIPNKPLKLSSLTCGMLSAAAFFLVAFGQAAWSTAAALFSAVLGYAFFWRALLNCETAKGRFWFGTLWFCAVQMVQLSWFLAHPYLYIWGVWLFFSFGIGLQFGLLSLLFVPDNIYRLTRLLVIASVWVIMEWSRLFFLAGYTWNPVGLSLASHEYPLQMGSIAGVYGLSFWVILTNLLTLRAWLFLTPASVAAWLTVAITPYLYGAIKLSKIEDSKEKIRVLLVQTAFPVEEGMHFTSSAELIQFVSKEWEKILVLTSAHQKRSLNLVVLPEFVVPLGTYTFVYPHDQVKEVFVKHYGPESAAYLPPLKSPWAMQKGGQWYVNNAFFAQAIANCIDCGVVLGLEDVEQTKRGWEHYSCAIYIEPQRETENDLVVYRYAKRVLVPMGEYIPFEWCKKLAARYGVNGSFTPGEEACLWYSGAIPFAPSICYEETFGHMMRESRLLGAHFLINLTSDAWYPNSRLPKQHLEHARLRTVENGFCLLRACNTGVTCALDAFGREAASLGDNEELSAALFVDMPLTHYPTLYTIFGDSLVIGISLLSCLLIFRKKGSP